MTQPPQNDGVPPTLRSASVELRRAENPESGGADCSDLGRFILRLDASDDQTAEADLGLSISLVNGKLPIEFPSHPVQGPRQASQEFSTWFGDKEGDISATLSVSVVDRAGNVSDPIEVGVSSDEGCGCSLVGSKTPGTAGWFGALLLLSFVRRRVGVRGG